MSRRKERSCQRTQCNDFLRSSYLPFGHCNCRNKILIDGEPHIYLLYVARKARKCPWFQAWIAYISLFRSRHHLQYPLPKWTFHSERKIIILTFNCLWLIFLSREKSIALLQLRNKDFWSLRFSNRFQYWSFIYDSGLHSESKAAPPILWFFYSHFSSALHIINFQSNMNKIKDIRFIDVCTFSIKCDVCAIKCRNATSYRKLFWGPVKYFCFQHRWVESVFNCFTVWKLLNTNMAKTCRKRTFFLELFMCYS